MSHLRYNSRIKDTDMYILIFFFCRSTSGENYKTDIRNISTTDCSSVAYLEHVTVDILFSYSGYRGESEFYLVSPSGTLSHLMHHRDGESDYFGTSGGSLSWKFMSVHYWWESPIGQWTLMFKSSFGLTVGKLLSDYHLFNIQIRTH